MYTITSLRFLNVSLTHTESQKRLWIRENHSKWLKTMVWAPISPGSDLPVLCGSWRWCCRAAWGQTAAHKSYWSNSSPRSLWHDTPLLSASTPSHETRWQKGKGWEKRITGIWTQQEVKGSRGGERMWKEGKSGGRGESENIGRKFRGYLHISHVLVRDMTHSRACKAQ